MGRPVKEKSLTRQDVIDAAIAGSMSPLQGER
jgi:hypothetical protein